MNQRAKQRATGPRRAVGYVRVSKSREEQTSTKTQRQAIERYVADKGWTLVEVREDDGRSAFKANVRRPGLDGAIEDYSTAIMINPVYALAHANRGYLQAARGRKDAAVSDLRQALLLDPSLVGARDALRRLGSMAKSRVESDRRVREGRALAERNCSGCHAIGQTGRSFNGNAPEFRSLTRRHNRRLYRIARSILRNESEAEDVMQQAYVNAYSHLRQFDGRSRFSTWLTRIAVHEALARARRRGRYTNVDLENPSTLEFPTPMASTPDPERLALSREIGALMETAIDRLPDGAREVFILRQVEGLSTAEVADVLEVGEAVVKTPIPVRNSFRWPNRSPSRPPRSMKPPNVRTYAFTTHASDSCEKPRSLRIDGRATFTIVMSTTIIRSPRHKTMSASQRLRLFSMVISSVLSIGLWG